MPASAALTLADPRYTLMQLPHNMQNPALAPVIDAATACGVSIAVNRPFSMGRMLYGEKPVPLAEAYRFVLARKFDGVVLTGTKSPAHLEQNVSAFHAAQK